ncbi:hypothetical protein HMPREF0849_01697 [Streptococcus sp. C300]|nr:hypothetical protein HMPREF0849_01697 [Streptococcus sp. C300]
MKGIVDESFGTIRNNTALKPGEVGIEIEWRFGTIRNNTALKLQSFTSSNQIRFWNHSKQHSSKTW